MKCYNCNQEHDEIYLYEGDYLCSECLLQLLIDECKIESNTIYTRPYGSFLGDDSNSTYEIIDNYIHDSEDNIKHLEVFKDE